MDTEGNLRLLLLVIVAPIVCVLLLPLMLVALVLWPLFCFVALPLLIIGLILAVPLGLAYVLLYLPVRFVWRHA